MVKVDEEIFYNTLAGSVCFKKYENGVVQLVVEGDSKTGEVTLGDQQTHELRDLLCRPDQKGRSESVTEDINPLTVRDKIQKIRDVIEKFLEEAEEEIGMELHVEVDRVMQVNMGGDITKEEKIKNIVSVSATIRS